MSQTVFNDDAKTPAAREDVELAVRTALADALERPVDEILPQSDLENDLGLDSLGLIQVNVAIEEQFHIPILDGESPEFALHTVEDLTTFVADKAETTRSYQEELI
jgi:acyl carrier protein